MIDPAVKTRLESLTPTYREFILSDFAQEAATQFGEVNQFGEEQTVLLSNGIILYLLAFLDLNELINFIVNNCKVSVENASQIVWAILDSLPDGFTEMHNTMYETFTANIKNSSSHDTEDLTSDIEETETAMKAIPNSNTVKQAASESQSEEEATYSSAQADILQENKPPTPNNAPRWGNEDK